MRETRTLRNIVIATIAMAVIALSLVAANADTGGTTYIYGTPGDDKLVGFRGHGTQVLVGYAGDDRLWGGRGPDVFRCGAGYDIVHSQAPGAESNDTISATCEVVNRGDGTGGPG